MRSAEFEYVTASAPAVAGTPESRGVKRLKRGRGQKRDARRTTRREIQTMAENGVAVAEPVGREELPKSFKDAVVDGEGETVVPKSFAEVVAEGVEEGAEEGERVNGENGDRERNGERVNGERNGDKKERRGQADQTNGDGGKSYASAVSTIQHPHLTARN